MDIWSLKSAFYHPMRCLPLMRRILNKEIENLKILIGQLDTRPSMILDLGTGSGSTLSIFPTNLPIVGIDRSLNMLLKTRNVIEVIGEVCQLPFRDRSVPFVSGVGLTEYLQNKEIFLDEVKRIIHPAGYFLVTISPPGVLNCLRNFLGNRIYTIRTENWESIVKRKGFECLGKEKTLFQIQYLFRAV